MKITQRTLVAAPALLLALSLSTTASAWDDYGRSSSGSAYGYDYHSKSYEREMRTRRIEQEQRRLDQQQRNRQSNQRRPTEGNRYQGLQHAW